MRVGLITGEYPPMEGGVGAFTQELAKALAEQGHEVHILTSRLARPQSQPKKVALLRDPIDLGYAHLFPVIRHWRWASHQQVVDWAIRFELDVVNVQYQAAAYGKWLPATHSLPWRLRGVVKTAVTFHDLRFPYLFPKIGDQLRIRAVHNMARQASGVIATNLIDYEQLKRIGCECVANIPIGSNIVPYTPNHIEIEDVRDQLGLNEESILLGYFGFLNPTKGADTLLQAVARLDERYHVVFIGGQLGASDSSNNASFLADLKRLIASLKLSQRVHWTGYLNEHRVSTFLHASDMVVMPYRDGASLRRGTLMAALAHGRPLITTWPVGPTPLLSHGENIWFVPVNDPEAIETAVLAIQSDPNIRARLATGASNVATHFSWRGIGKQTADFLRRLRETE